MSNQTTKGNKVIRTIKDKDGRVIGEVNENTYLIDIQKACPTFFKPFGKSKRETFQVYRGQLITRHTTQFTGCKPVRLTVVYLYFVSGELVNDTLCISAGSKCNDLRQAKKLIDDVLDGGVYYYGI